MCYWISVGTFAQLGSRPLNITKEAIWMLHIDWKWRRKKKMKKREEEVEEGRVGRRETQTGERKSEGSPCAIRRGPLTSLDVNRKSQGGGCCMGAVRRA